MIPLLGVPRDATVSNLPNPELFAEDHMTPPVLHTGGDHDVNVDIPSQEDDPRDVGADQDPSEEEYNHLHGIESLDGCSLAGLCHPAPSDQTVRLPV